jgi:hypothetical protein
MSSRVTLIAAVPPITGIVVMADVTFTLLDFSSKVSSPQAIKKMVPRTATAMMRNIFFVIFC